LKNLKNFRKGFVGPLGDDIPSIFPIVAGLMLFLGTLAFASNLVAQKNAYLEVERAAVSLSYIATEKGFVTQAGWASKCPSLEKAADANGVRVFASVKRFCGEIDFPNSVSDPASPYYAEQGYAGTGGRTWLACTNDDDVGSHLQRAQPTVIVPQRQSSILFSYPVAVPCPGTDSPTFGHGVLNLLVWR